jgi:tetratricopeptide (TPR) repeat protein
MKLLPGVRLNFSKETIGMSFGVPGARYTINSKGRKTFSTGIPGTGLYNVETLSSGSRSRRGSEDEGMSSAEATWENTNPNNRPPAPGLFARKAERELNTFLHDIYDAEAPDGAASVIEKAAALRAKYEELKFPLELIAFLHGITDDKYETEAAEWGASLWQYRQLVFNDKYVRKYFTGIKPSVTISTGITTSLNYNEQTLGFIWAEVLQGQKKFDEAVAVLLEMVPDQMVGISLADIEVSKGDFDGAIETTEDIEVFDDATAMMMVLRGVAFRGKDMQEAAVECFKRVLKEQKILPEALVHRTLFERAESYALMGKKAMAIKDLEKILVDEPNYPEVEKKLAALK